MYSGVLVSSPQGEPWPKPLYNYNFVYVFPDNFLFLFVYNLAWRPDRPLKPIEQENCQKGTSVEGTGGGRGRGGAVGPTYFFILSLGVMRFLHLFHHFHIALRVCILFVYCWCTTIWVMTWHTGEYHVNERCHRANQCFSYVFCVFSDGLEIACHELICFGGRAPHKPIAKK